MSDSLRDFMDRKTIADILDEIAALLDVKGENAFRVRAFRAAARALLAFGGELRPALTDGSLAQVRGIGPVTLGIIRELVTTGRAAMLEDLRREIPSGMVEMLEGTSLGVAKVRQVREGLGIDSLAELEAAARDGRLAALPRFGPKTAASVLKTIEARRAASGLRLMHHAAAAAEPLRVALSRLPGVSEAVTAGEVRRRTEIAGAPTILVVADRPASELFVRATSLPGVREYSGEARGATLSFADGASARILVSDSTDAGAALVEATGSESHLAALAEHAAVHGLRLQDGALWRGATRLPAPDEQTLYQSLGLAWIPPELREGRDEVRLAGEGALPRLLERSDLRGFLHCHTKDSDGSNTLEQIADASRAAGYEYAGITDHSQAAFYAGGLKPDQLRRQIDAIESLNDRLSGFRLLKGIEADILQSGEVDYEPALLERLDFVIASVHGRFNMDRRAMTARMLAALDNPFVTILGHPTGRLLLSRDPYPVDLDAVIARAAERGVALEINADPHRLDLDWRRAADARAAGAMISIGADAHSLGGIGNAEYGVAMARKAGLGPADILNTLSADAFITAARRRRG